MKIILNPKEDPQWDQVGRIDHDFKSVWGGMYVHLYSTILPQESAVATMLMVERCCREIAGNLLCQRSHFSADDRFQIVIGWPADIRGTHRQIVKTGGSWDELEELIKDEIRVKFYPGWDSGIFPRM